MEQGWTGALVRAFVSYQFDLGSIIPSLNAVYMHLYGLKLLLLALSLITVGGFS